MVTCVVSLLKRSNERKQVFNEYKIQKGKEERVSNFFIIIHYVVVASYGSSANFLGIAKAEAARIERGLSDVA